jgi:Oxidoreductase family, NAD-binding Rossmann fold
VKGLLAVIELPKYVIVGRGRWASRMTAILAGENRRVAFLEQSRRAPSEDDSAYRERLRSSFKTSGAEVTWLCVLPGDHIPIMIEAAVEAGLHVVAEKPWFCSAEETRRMQALGQTHKAVLAIHYEYCLLEQVETWRREWSSAAGLSFAGHMKVNRPNHTGIPALDNLGSHLFSIQEYCVPKSVIAKIDCRYEQPDERRVWLTKQDSQIAEIDLLANKEPIIQRFIARVEAAIGGLEFPLDLSFALKVAERTALWREQTR